MRDARRRAGLTQTELARRAGISQSVVSAYESDHRQPALSTLAVLIEATGFDLDIRVTKRKNLSGLTGPIGRRVRRRRQDLVTVAARHGITNLRLFGSVARGEDRPDSDVDLAADIPADLGVLGLGRVTDELERILGTHVDLVPADGLKPDVAARVEQDAIRL
jgi:predicted nucleotidyltransferase/DNA-binding XRE family transcriptional regulator